MPISGDDTEAVIVRMYTEKSHTMNVDIGSLGAVMKLAAAGGVATLVLAEFNNGIVYEYTTGEPLDPDKYVHNQHIQR